MLFNQQGKEVKLSDKLNSKTHPHVFAPLREIHVTNNHSCGNMFSLENRVKFKQ